MAKLLPLILFVIFVTGCEKQTATSQSQPQLPDSKAAGAAVARARQPAETVRQQRLFSAEPATAEAIA